MSRTSCLMVLERAVAFAKLMSIKGRDSMNYDVFTNKNLTLTDVRLAAAYYPILLEIARDRKVGSVITYGDLVTTAKERYPENETVQNAIPVSTGRRLEIVRLFTNDRSYPDLSSLVVNSKGECGSGFTDRYDPETARKAVYGFDWSGVTSEFDVFIEGAVEVVKPKKKISRNEAVSQMSAHYKENKGVYPADIKSAREQIIEFIVDGFSVEMAFENALK
jgi:hypothetical protein